MSENKVTFGLEKVHIAFFDESVLGQPAWEKPIPIPGAVRWTPTAAGGESSFFADNTKYFTITANNGYTGELEIALLPDEVQAKMHGWVIDDNGALIEIADAIPKKFALLGQVQGDKRNRRFVHYDVQASRPNKERTTKGENVEVATEVLPVTVSPIEIEGKRMVKGDLELSDANQAAYDSFFDEVYTPVFGGTGE